MGAGGVLPGLLTKDAGSEEGGVRSLKVQEEEKQFEVCGRLLCRVSHDDYKSAAQGLLLNYLVDSTFKMQFPGSGPLLYS